MKTLSKKLLTMLLAVVMLVSVVPFQAMATTTDSEPHNMKVKFVDEAGNILAAPVAQNDYIGAAFPLTAEDAQAWLADTNVDLTKWEIPTSYQTLYPTQNNNGVWVYTVTLTAKEEPTTPPTTEEPTTPPTTEEPTVPPTTEEPTTPPTTEEPTEPEEDKSTIKLMVDGKLYATATIRDGKVGVLPTEPLKNGKQFTAWYANENGTGDKLYKGMPADEVDDDRTYHAAFKTSDDDGLGNLTVYAKFYVGGKLKDTVKLHTERDLENGTNAFDWLTANKDLIYNAIFDRVDAEDYEWEDRYYYDYEGKEPLSKQDLVMDGDRSVVVKVYSKHESNVLLYVHRKVSSAAENIYEMGGYVKGDVVTREDVESVVKKHYSGKRTIKGLYSDEAWSQLKNGEEPTQANGITVDSNGTVKIHILLSNATSNGNADSSNPKTGDSIFMTVTVMAVSAIALAGAYVFNKKRMVK